MRDHFEVLLGELLPQFPFQLEEGVQEWGRSHKSDLVFDLDMDSMLLW
jgi:hypothetical protein